MTIRGDGSSLVTYKLEASDQLSISSLEQANQAIDTLFARLESDEVDFDTTTGNITFPFSNGQSDMTGNTKWTRMFQDWVFIGLREIDASDEIKHAQTLVMNGLHQKAKQRLGT